MNNYFQAYPLYLKASDIMDALQVSKTKAYEILQRPDCPTVTLGKSKRVHRDKFFEYIVSLEGKTLPA
ncbi:DNA-binding protein [Paenibacillus chitinolyticus]|uniref:DNA-binding protein n=1 Tax=Paenibacillus chitinolyticus TaxID=79263 RepID=A0A410X0M9_9BACL|nr:hypothetical protein [Paenibacillus chitinolyticus]MCY9593757.1 DNA-binding protein [Paenibacillus chitinolyticus]MCY9599678.1 DNA-binding protein [Paenibacillus chitinolyticus]QAV20147.1 DNA-binding protein [Paenibacillus chitinolyticus]